MNFCAMICGGGDEAQLIDTSADEQHQVDLKDPFAAHDTLVVSSPSEDVRSGLDDFAAAATTTAPEQPPVATGDLIQF